MVVSDCALIVHVIGYFPVVVPYHHEALHACTYTLSKIIMTVEIVHNNIIIYLHTIKLHNYTYTI